MTKEKDFGTMQQYIWIKEAMQRIQQLTPNAFYIPEHDELLAELKKTYAALKQLYSELTQE